MDGGEEEEGKERAHSAGASPAKIESIQDFFVATLKHTLEELLAARKHDPEAQKHPSPPPSESSFEEEMDGGEEEEGEERAHSAGASRAEFERLEDVYVGTLKRGFDRWLAVQKHDFEARLAAQKHALEAQLAAHEASWQQQLAAFAAAHGFIVPPLPIPPQSTTQSPSLADGGQECPELMALALAHKARVKATMPYNKAEASAYSIESAYSRIVTFRTLVRETNGSDYDPSEHDLDTEVVRLDDDIHDTASTPTLSQIRARSTRSSPPIRPRPEPALIAMEARPVELERKQEDAFPASLKHGFEPQLAAQTHAFHLQLVTQVAAQMHAFEAQVAAQLAAYEAKWQQQLAAFADAHGFIVPPMPILPRSSPESPHPSDAGSNELGSPQASTHDNPLGSSPQC